MLPTLTPCGMVALILAGAAGWALLYVAAETARLPRALGIAKIVTTLLIGCVLLVPSPTEPRRLAAFAAAIVLSAIGDAFLLDSKRFFTAGLASFLVAHLAFIVGFWSDRWALLPLLVLLVGAGIVVAAIRHSVGSLLGPVVAYMLVITFMAWKAWNWSALAGVGASFFVLSDALIAIDKFLRPVPARGALVLGTYWLAQSLIVMAAIGV